MRLSIQCCYFEDGSFLAKSDLRPSFSEHRTYVTNSVAPYQYAPLPPCGV